MIIDEYECYMYKKKRKKKGYSNINRNWILYFETCMKSTCMERIYIRSPKYIYIYFIKNRIFMKYLIIIIILLESFKFMIYIKVANIINKYNLVYEKK